MYVDCISALCWMIRLDISWNRASFTVRLKSSCTCEIRFTPKSPCPKEQPLRSNCQLRLSVFQACGSFICMVFSQCNASWLKQTNFAWVGETEKLLWQCFVFPKRSVHGNLAAPRLWLKPHWSSCALPVRVFWLKMTRAGALSNLVADQPQKVFVETSIANNFFLFSFMTWIFFRIAILACLSHIWEHEILFPKLLESKALHFRDSDFAHLRGWENLFPSLPSRKSTSEGAVCKPFWRFATRESFFSCHLCGYKLILGEKLKVFCRDFSFLSESLSG